MLEGRFVRLEPLTLDHVAGLIEASSGDVDRATGRVVGTTRFCYIEFWGWPEGSPYQRGTDLPNAVEIGYTW